MVSATQSRQPHWITPLVTVTPLLEQEVRYDVRWLPNSSGTIAENYGDGKGVEFIPERNIEVILAVPPYLVHNQPGVRDGFGDFQALVKYRLAASEEEKGNYVLTVFLAVSAPTGQFANGESSSAIKPTIAYGKGLGAFDYQGTFGASLPTHDAEIIGRTYTSNNAFQVRLLRKIWPEIEVNYSLFEGGKNDGKTQVFVTPGIVVGKIRLRKRVGLTVGGGFQIATTHFRTSNHTRILSVRFPF